MDKGSKAIGYIRVSTDQQVLDGVSLDAQQAKVRAWAAVNDYDLVSVYVDAGLSGGRADNRPQLQAALDHVCKIGGALVVYSLSRLARSTKDTLVISERLDRAGADLVSLSEKIDTTTAAGKMVFRMLAVLSEFERDQLAERTKMALAYKRSNSERISGRIPFGYELAADGTHLVENDQEQVIIRLIVDLREQGLSYQGIADELTRRGINPKNSTVWHSKVVMEIFKRAAA